MQPEVVIYHDFLNWDQVLQRVRGERKPLPLQHPGPFHRRRWPCNLSLLYEQIHRERRRVLAVVALSWYT